MTAAVQTVGWIETLAFCGLAIVTVVDWLRHGGQQRAALAWALGLFAFVALAGRAADVNGQQPRWLALVTVPVFLGSGFALVIVRHTFIPVRRRTLQVLLGLVVLVSVVFDVLPPPANPQQPGGLYLLAAVAFILLWCGFIIEPVVRFWMAARNRPAVQRARLRALSLGYGGIVAVLLVAIGVAVGAGTASAQSGPYQLVIGLVVLAIIPQLYISFAPPAWLRRFWRGREESAFRLATSALLVEEDPVLLARDALGWALRLTGADAGLIAVGPGEVLAATNLDGDVLARIIALQPGDAPRLADMGTQRHPMTAMLAPLRAPGVEGMMAVIAGSFTPVFGADELSRLGEYSVSVAAALDRVRLVRALAEQTHRNEGLLAAVSDLGDGLIVTEGTDVVYVNDAYCAIIGYSADEVREMGIPLDVSAAQPEPVDERPLPSPENRPDHFEARLVRHDGTPLEVEIARQRLGSGAAAQTTAIVRDISERVRAAHELSRRATELERSNAALQEFAYVASHDLQEPLRMVTSYLQLLRSRYRDALDSDADEFIDFAVDGARRMQDLINDLLLYSRVGTSDAAMTEVPLDEVLQAAVSNLSPAIEEAGAVITVAPLPTVVGDRSQLVQLFQNLLSNAVKFRGTRTPEIRVTAHHGDHEAVLTVSDNGIGIEKRHAERIFLIFKRLHPASEYPGTGIGLSVCRKVAERHGGRIWVESTPGEGTTFHVALPDTAVRPAAVPGPLTVSPAHERRADDRVAS